MNFNTKLRVTRPSGETTASGHPLHGDAARKTVYAEVLAKLEPLRMDKSSLGSREAATVTDQAVARNHWPDIKAYDFVEDLKTKQTYQVVSVKRFGRSHLVLDLTVET